MLFPLPLPPFSYLVPFERAPPPPGARVAVPWQQGVRLGLVLELEEVAAGKALEFRELLDVLDDQPFVLPERLALVSELAEASCTPAGLVLASLLPTGLTGELEHLLQPHGDEDLGPLAAGRWQPAQRLSAADLELYRRQGLLRERVRPRQTTVRMLRAVREPDEALRGRAQAKQREALELLQGYDAVPSAAEFARDNALSESALRSLIKKGYARYDDLPTPPPPLPAYPPEPLEALELNLSATAPALSLAGGYRRDRLAALLPLLQRDLRAGGSVLLLVPEAALVAETASCLAGHCPVQVLTGDLSDAQRQRLWSELMLAEPLVLVGSYLALLAPLAGLSRIVVLEAGSSSYKLPSGPRLFVPSVARMLAERLEVPILYTDALPSPETLHHVPEPHRLTLPYPAQRLHVVDLSSSRNWPLSTDLVQVLKQVAARDRQAVVLSPRRGFSAALGCASCGHIAQCPNCDLPLRYHRQPVELRCHQCGFHTAPPQLCPNCQSSEIGPMRGAGTEWLMREIRTHVGPLPLYHYDADQRDDLSPLQGGEPGIVVATTAILRHAPLPNVSLVAVTLLDTLLSASDFRAEEEVLRLLLQLAELQPQRRPLLLVQTFQARHPVLEVLRAEDPAAAAQAFLARLLARRRAYRYPPYSAMAKVQLSSRDRMTAEREAALLAAALGQVLQTGDELLGPSPAPIPRLKSMYSYQLFVRSAEAGRLPELLRPVRAYAGRARLRVDVDPRDIGSYLE